MLVLVSYKTNEVWALLQFWDQTAFVTKKNLEVSKKVCIFVAENDSAASSQ